MAVDQTLSPISLHLKIAIIYFHILKAVCCYFNKWKIKVAEVIPHIPIPEVSTQMLIPCSSSNTDRQIEEMVVNLGLQGEHQCKGSDL